MRILPSLKGKRVTDYRSSELWQRTLKARENDPFESWRDRLRVAFDGFWQRGTELAERISTDLPGLTLHDDKHLAALWDRASQLTGKDYKINPLEAFVFGGAVLLHDAGHAVAAYEGGLPELKGTTEYRDAVVAALRKTESNPSRELISNPPDAIAKIALFNALRRLHAKQAESLATRAFQGQYLLDDNELRDNVAQLIGRIAASHHWDRTLLDEKLPRVQGPPGFMPQEWTIKAVKLAFLLRCSDVIQIDQRRAPAFALGVHAPEGPSALHWLAQQLGQPVVMPDTDGPGALRFTSQNDFAEDKADAWWVAHDLIKLANEELQGCHQIMRSMDLQAFTVDRIAGAESPQQLGRFIRTAGWRPVSVDVRVTNVQQIVRLFGGEVLYGRDPAVPLRELIQNAADAVRPRRAWAKNDPFYEGKVIVRLNACEKDDLWQLVVEDNGTGMSEHTLTGPLIEFGKSFWISEEAQDEFPGLVGANLNQIGRYGIGFFSTLTIAKRIVVTSRRWDTGHDQANTLTFRDGLRLRPLLSRSREASLGQFSTRVELYITSDSAEQLLTVSRVQQGNFKVTLKELVAHLCPCLDCDVWVSQDCGQLELAHSRRWYEIDALQWIREIVFANPRADEIIDSYLAKVASLIRVLKGADGEPCGRAAIAFGQIEAGLGSIGGLASNWNSRKVSNFSTAYVGALSFEPSGPRRDSGPLSGPRAEVEAWASEQARLLAKFEINELEKYVAAINVAEFGGDPTPIATVLINRKPMALSAVYEILASGKTIFAAAEGPASGPHQMPSISTVHHWNTRGYGIGFRWDELDFVEVTMEAWRGRMAPDQFYHQTPTEEFPAQSCFLSCLKSYARSKGRTLQWELVHDALFAHYKGEASPREKLSTGTEVRGRALKLSLV
jgi:Histidine kinase-, DNA gyrase B-, and HSP90-like ATPase